jgi:hypothetical protein
VILFFNQEKKKVLGLVKLFFIRLHKFYNTRKHINDINSGVEMMAF